MGNLRQPAVRYTVQKNSSRNITGRSCLDMIVFKTERCFELGRCFFLILIVLPAINPRSDGARR